ncbi:MAG TPA: hypothetical protein VKD71_02510 [Gemmataceae bacterium]|nr:hypothetical protein [Gemmataceae bacterium]
MIISHKYRFIFVKTLKTAGTSIEVFLSQHCGPLDVVTPIFPHLEPHVPRNDDGYFNHISAAEIRSRVGPDVWRNYFKFCVERNPWDKTLSYYHMMNVRQGGGLSLDQFLAGNDFPVNHPKYTDPLDALRVIVDRVLSYERLTEDIGRVFRDLGIPFEGSLGVNAKSEYRTDRQPYWEVYTPAQAYRVATVFAQERRLHGYAF